MKIMHSCIAAACMAPMLLAAWHQCHLLHDNNAACCMAPMLLAAWHQCCLMHDTNAACCMAPMLLDAWHQCCLMHDTNAACCMAPMLLVAYHQFWLLHGTNAAFCMTPMLLAANLARLHATCPTSIFMKTPELLQGYYWAKKVWHQIKFRHILSNLICSDTRYWWSDTKTVKYREITIRIQIIKMFFEPSQYLVKPVDTCSIIL